MEELAQDELGVGGERALIERAIHERDPAIAGALIQTKRVMPHPQPRMATRLFVTRRPAKAAHQELPQSQFGARQVDFRIHRPQHLVFRHLRVERRHQSGEAVFANSPVDVAFRKPGFRHQTII